MDHIPGAANPIRPAGLRSPGERTSRRASRPKLVAAVRKTACFTGTRKVATACPSSPRRSDRSSAPSAATKARGAPLRGSVVTTQPQKGAPRAFVAADGAELLGLRRSDDGHAVATLRLSVRQAVFLTAATSFGRDARLLVRSPGDRAPAGRIGYAAPGL